MSKTLANRIEMWFADWQNHHRFPKRDPSNDAVPSHVYGEWQMDCALYEAAQMLREVLDRDPDYIYNTNSWNSTISWENRGLITDYLDFGDGIVGLVSLYSGPTKFVARVPVTFDENGDPDETEVQWFDTREEAEAAVSRRPTS